MTHKLDIHKISGTALDRSMGPTKLAAMLKRCAGPKRDVDDITLSSAGTPCVIGMDMMCVLVTLVKSSDAAAEENHADPPLPQHHVARGALERVKKHQRKGNYVIPVFDGISRTPLKQECAGEDRDAARAKALKLLKKLLKTPWPSDEDKQQQILKEISSARKASAKVNENLIAEVMQVFYENGIDYVVAPFEADWQLAYMYREGIIDAIETKDADYWALLDEPCCLLEVNSSNLKGYYVSVKVVLSVVRMIVCRRVAVCLTIQFTMSHALELLCVQLCTEMITGVESTA